MAEPSIPPGFDFTDPDRCVLGLPTEELAELRRTAPVWWSKQPRGTGGFDDDGYWREKKGRGHARRARIDTFLQHYLTVKLRDEVPALK